MGEIDDAHDAEDQGEPARDQEQHQAVLDAIEELNQERIDIHWAERWALTTSLQFAAARWIGKGLDGNADDFILLAFDFSQIHIVHRIVCLR